MNIDDFPFRDFIKKEEKRELLSEVVVFLYNEIRKEKRELLSEVVMLYNGKEGKEKELKLMSLRIRKEIDEAMRKILRVYVSIGMLEEYKIYWDATYFTVGAKTVVGAKTIECVESWDWVAFVGAKTIECVESWDWVAFDIESGNRNLRKIKLS